MDAVQSEFGLRSPSFQKLRQYLGGVNNLGRYFKSKFVNFLFVSFCKEWKDISDILLILDTEIAFHYPVMIRVTPHINNTITRATCVIISHFDSKVMGDSWMSKRFLLHIQKSQCLTWHWSHWGYFQPLNILLKVNKRN